MICAYFSRYLLFKEVIDIFVGILTICMTICARLNYPSLTDTLGVALPRQLVPSLSNSNERNTVKNSWQHLNHIITRTIRCQGTLTFIAPYRVSDDILASSRKPSLLVVSGRCVRSRRSEGLRLPRLRNKLSPLNGGIRRVSYKRLTLCCKTRCVTCILWYTEGLTVNF